MRDPMGQLPPSALGDRLWTVTELAEFLGVRPKTVYGWVEQGSVPHYKIGGRVRFDWGELERWLKARRGGV